MSSTPHPFFISFFPSPVSLVRPRRRLSLAPTAYCRRPARAGCVKAGRFSAATIRARPLHDRARRQDLMGRVDYTPISYLAVYVSAEGGVIVFRSRMLFFCRSCYEVHGACDSRINLYPAAPIRLSKVLLAWTIAQVDGAHLLNGILASANLRCGSTATHPTCPTHPTGVSELSALSRKGRSLRNQTLLEITPEGNGELARDGNDHAALNAPVLPFGPLRKTLGNRAGSRSAGIVTDNSRDGLRYFCRGLSGSACGQNAPHARVQSAVPDARPAKGP